MQTCAALHQSEVDKRLLFSSVFLFFLSLDFGKRKKIWIPAELKIDVCAAAVQSLPALQSHPCRGIMKRPTVPSSPEMIRCKYLILLSLPYISLSLPPSCGCCLFLYPQSFVFILTFTRFTQPSFQFRLVSYIVYPAGEEGMSGATERAAPSLFRIAISFFFVILAEHRESHRDVHSEIC